MGVETEIKLATTPEMLARLLADPRLAATDGTEIRERLVSTYFDTADSRLHAAGAALRIRERAREGGGAPHREQTLKFVAAQQAAIRRHEWNAPLPEPHALPQPDLWPPAPRAALAALLGGADLQTLGATYVTRVRRRIRHGAATIDIMADSGEIACAHAARRPPICELELELIEGDLADTLLLAASLPLGPDLAWVVAGKGARCRALAHGQPLCASLAPPVRLSRAMDIAAAFHAIGWSCLNHLLANYPLVLGAASGGKCAEAVHQSRVAIRRLRAAFSLFGAGVADARGDTLRAGFKSAGAALAPARDAHVLLENLTADLTATAAQDAHTAPLLAHLAEARDAATNLAQTYLASGEFQRLLVDFALWLERGDWREEASAPLADEVHAILHRRQRKARHHARATDLAHDEQLHALRIEFKKLRYAIDFTSSSMPNPHARKQALAQERLLGKLQNVLGDLHDIALAEHPKTLAGTLAGTAPVLPPAEAAALAQALSAHTAALAAKRPRLLARAEKLLAQNAKTPHWWAD